MADVHSKEIRSYNMSRIKGKNTKPEMLVRKFLHANGFRYRLHVKDLPGKPDIVLPKYKTVIFIQGCFWHGHDQCKFYSVPKTNTEFWVKKINDNKLKDQANLQIIREQGWKVIEIWGCQLKSSLHDDTLNILQKALGV